VGDTDLASAIKTFNVADPKQQGAGLDGFERTRVQELELVG